jgi:hypothetical protein
MAGVAQRHHLSVGMINVFDLDPPFGAGQFENGYNESASDLDLKGRFWYVALKKKF